MTGQNWRPADIENAKICQHILNVIAIGSVKSDSCTAGHKDDCRGPSCLTMPHILLPHCTTFVEQISLYHTPSGGFRPIRLCGATSTWHSVVSRTVAGDVVQAAPGTDGSTSFVETTTPRLLIFGDEPRHMDIRGWRYGPRRLRVNDDDEWRIQGYWLDWMHFCNL